MNTYRGCYESLGQKEPRKRVCRLKYSDLDNNVRDEHIQELEEELRKTRLIWDVMGISEVRRPEECFTTLQSGHLICYSKANNGQAGVGFLINRKLKDHIVSVNSISPRASEHVLCITKRNKLDIVQVYAPTIIYSEEDK